MNFTTNIKKTLFAAIALVMGTGILHAEHVDKSAAREAAAQFMQGLNPQASLIAEPAQKAPRRNAEGAASSTEAYYYIFNAKNNQGFVIISGDDRTPQVLGYSDKGMIDSEIVPVNLQEMLDSYEAQIKLLDTMSDYEAGKAMGRRRTKDATRNSISPMITTNWDQAEPYWNKLPHFMKSNDEDETEYDLPYTGCVATSMAQIMKYYNFPEKTTQAIPSYTFTISGDNYSYSTATMDELPITTFDWAHMLDNYTGAEDEVYTDAVANLMLYAGHAVKMAYGTSASGAYTDEIPGGFTNYFGYDPNTIKIAYRNAYSQEDWANLIYSELAAGRPMVYNGTAGSGGGHSFVCDGYQSGEYFHINWGWGGMSNGFFLLEVMNPHASGIGGASSSEGYNMNQNAIIGIQPGDASAVEPVEEVLSLSATLVVCNESSAQMEVNRDGSSEPFKLTKRKRCKISFANHNKEKLSFSVGIALYNSDGTTMLGNVIASVNYSNMEPSSDGNTWSFPTDNSSTSLSFGQGISDGTYRIVPVCKLVDEADTEWRPMIDSDRYYYLMTVSGNNATVVCHPIVNLEATSFVYTGGEKVGSAEKVDVTIKNNSEDRFHGDLYLFVDGENIDEYGQYTTVIEAEVPANGEKTVTFNFTPIAAGTKSVEVSLNDQGNKLITGTSSITIAAADDGKLDLSVAIEAVNGVAQEPTDTECPIHGNIYDTHAKFKVTITNNDAYEYHRYILVPLFICTEKVETNDDGTSNRSWDGQMVTYKMETITVAAGATKDYYYEFDNLAPGSVYSLNVYARNDNANDAEGNKTTNITGSGKSKFYQINSGVVSWTSAGVRTSAAMDGAITVAEDAAAVSIMGLGNEVQITPNANPNCLYFLDADQTVPAGLEGKNVIKGYQAENIVLADGYDYYTPYTFEATNISYSRTFAQGRATEGGEKGWETLVLPFETTVVTDANGTALSWYTSDNDTEGKFWLCNFAEEEGDETYFSYVTSVRTDGVRYFAADRPYLIAVPEGSELVGSTLTFKGTDAKLKPGVVAVTSGKVHSLVGTYVKTSVENAYKMNVVGHEFDLDAAAQEIASFHAYFNTLEGQTSDATVLPINFKLTGDVTLTGDVNLDGVVDLADVTALVDCITSKAVGSDKYGVTDLNEDGNTDEQDVAALVQILLDR